MSDEHGHLDVSRLPSVVFDHHSVMWWGALGFVVIEGFTLVLAATAYLYLRLNEPDWPPGRTPNPELIIPTINLVLLLLVIVPMRAVDRAARRFDRRAVMHNLFIAAAMTIPIVALRWWEIVGLNVRYDAHAYASAAWAVVLLHSTLIIVDMFETATLGWYFHSGRAQKKHYPDASDAAFYQYFLSLGWIPYYLLIYWGPRVL